MKIQKIILQLKILIISIFIASPLINNLQAQQNTKNTNHESNNGKNVHLFMKQRMSTLMRRFALLKGNRLKLQKASGILFAPAAETLEYRIIYKNLKTMDILRILGL